MEILAVRPQLGSGNTLALFDVQLGEHVRLFNLKLVRGRNGLRVYSPNAFGSNVAVLSATLADRLAQAAMVYIGEVTGHDTKA